jgi:hypothetical protein
LGQHRCLFGELDSGQPNLFQYVHRWMAPHAPSGHNVLHKGPLAMGYYPTAAWRLTG